MTSTPKQQIVNQHLTQEPEPQLMRDDREARVIHSVELENGRSLFDPVYYEKLSNHSDSASHDDRHDLSESEIPRPGPGRQ
ncbi:unnamed protein product [Ambrosiozyma monospora]|uniref:Unnamed protein product n=1 Tax=Ambrosiozyma monospora TaxID=43982 RepID=A0A9W6YNX4_AMBMO|nr:unnamed protein product [Ambrosiozyma monospora]